MADAAGQRVKNLIYLNFAQIFSRMPAFFPRPDPRA